eukprot:NODE_6251_length_907_cov_28.618622_g5659_i0.p1 GENE.NODE_6251_length_907_cov_28.618622_g5659_i0~~NODE_6251_length_907_cov_28.618622_g5659_i0.p1  ORF type:complete len:269 (+),score=54.18 NODE_6251_length_907_cov_28.618622_g5659_i0:40-807(+)
MNATVSTNAPIPEPKCKPYDLFVGPSKESARVIEVNSVLTQCDNVPINRQQVGWTDKFKVVVNNGKTVVIMRLDTNDNKGWGQDLRIRCQICGDSLIVPQNPSIPQLQPTNCSYETITLQPTNLNEQTIEITKSFDRCEVITTKQMDNVQPTSPALIELKKSKLRVLKKGGWATEMKLRCRLCPSPIFKELEVSQFDLNDSTNNNITLKVLVPITIVCTVAVLFVFSLLKIKKRRFNSGLDVELNRNFITNSENI